MGKGNKRFWCGNLKDRIHLEETSAHGKIILKLIFKERHGLAWTGFLELRIGGCLTCCEHCHAASDFVKCEKF
jgi:hypothetical protein